MRKDRKDHSRLRLKAFSLPLADLVKLDLIDQDGASAPHVALTWEARNLDGDGLAYCVLGVVVAGSAADHDSESVI